jgi:hypothetical protein
MRRVLPNIVTVAAIVLCAVSVGLWIWSHRDTRFLLSDFFKGRFDGDRAWRGYYLAVSRGHIAYELEQISYAKQPAAAPINRWAAEDAVELRTPALRAFPFDGPLGFHFVNERATSNAGALRTLRLGFPLWALLGVSVVPLLYRCRGLLRGRSGTKAVPAAA